MVVGDINSQQGLVLCCDRVVSNMHFSEYIIMNLFIFEKRKHSHIISISASTYSVGNIYYASIYLS